MRGVAPLLALLAGPAFAGGMECPLTYTCALGVCAGGQISVHIEDRDGQAGVVTDEGFFPVDKRIDAATGWVTYVTPVDNAAVYFLTVTPDGTALASGHEVSTSDGAVTVYAASGTCKAVE